jgi:uncharacterized protein YjbJ (UPF0337 family)
VRFLDEAEEGIFSGENRLERRPLDVRGKRPPTAPRAGIVFALTSLRLHAAGQNWRAIMNEDQVKGVGEKVKGKINEGVGKMTNDPAQEAKGDAQQVEGQVRKDLGDAKEDLKDATDHTAKP